MRRFMSSAVSTVYLYTDPSYMYIYASPEANMPHWKPLCYNATTEASTTVVASMPQKVLSDESIQIARE
jgi:hypothetical protein